MNTIENFKNAPIGATATHKVTGTRAMKMNNDEWCWIVKDGFYKDNEGMMYCDYTLDAPAPTTAREALDIAWELAHPVKPGQVIPKGTRYLEDQGSGLKEKRIRYDIDISPALAPHIRTLASLPDPEPDWLDAPAVIATTIGNDNHRTFTNVGNSRWHTPGEKSYLWSSLHDVTPLYPKEV